jgi:5-methylcytosine-specific restriction endonuclease McrA
MLRRLKYTPPKRPKWNADTEILADALFQSAVLAAGYRGEEVNVEELFNKSWERAVTYDRLLAAKKLRYVHSNPDYDRAMNEVRERDKNRCKQCDSGESPEVHHIIPVSLAPELACEHWNMLVLCRQCHQLVTGRELEFRAQFQRLVDKPHNLKT